MLDDLNEDTMSNSNFALLWFMSSTGQVISTPTTNRSTMIDLVFVRNLPFTVAAIDVNDSYYSDHDAIFCTLNIDC